MPKLPAEHIGNIPAGHKRDEEVRRRNDDLAQRLEEDQAEVGQEPIDPAKMGKIDNEIAREWDREERRARRTGMPRLSNPVAGYQYGWFPIEDFFRNSDARAAVRACLDQAKLEGYFPVTDDHDANVGREFKNPPGGDTLRRWGDCVLFGIRLDDYRILQQRNQMMLQRMGAVEENYVNFGRNLLRGRGTAYDQRSDRMARYMGAEKMQPFTATAVADDQSNRR